MKRNTLKVYQEYKRYTVDVDGLIKPCYFTYIGSLTLPIFLSSLSFRDKDSTTVKVTLSKLCRILKKSNLYRYSSEIREFVKLFNEYRRKGYRWKSIENMVDDKYQELKIQNILLFRIEPIYYKHKKRIYRVYKYIKHGININKFIKGV